MDKRRQPAEHAARFGVCGSRRQHILWMRLTALSMLSLLGLPSWLLPFLRDLGFTIPEKLGFAENPLFAGALDALPAVLKACNTAGLRPCGACQKADFLDSTPKAAMI